MYGTPLSEEARNFRIDAQKELILFLKSEASIKAREAQRDSIILSDISGVAESILNFGKKKGGIWYVRLENGDIIIPGIDMEQYGSVSYSYRSMLSVEQDLFFIPDITLLPFSKETIEPVYQYVNLVTLASLKIADELARNNNLAEISRANMSDSWLLLFRSAPEDLQDFEYPQLKAEYVDQSKIILDGIIQQKLDSYEQYSEVSTSVFLRNIQVYFAKQRWPIDSLESSKLKNYLLESLVGFGSSIIQESQKLAYSEDEPLIRLNHVQQTLHSFIPFDVNQFEDVIFFPNSSKDKIMVESYDLDAFRDSGWHWQILQFAINDLSKEPSHDIDPNAAELITEGIAQMGVLVLRLAGNISRRRYQGSIFKNSKSDKSL